ncbi:MAG TPA: aromatic ring-hydroxylating dioxygenase subunit alpha [Polyangiaceae bacterium]|nr:aromatic ring-hydroxylating dioxygenase subunit alpha [Polyangiaceae bacterium]
MQTLPFTLAELERVLSPLEPCGLPRAAYTDEAVHEFELERIFGRSWSCVGREQELAGPGEFLRARVAGQELLIVRGVDLELRAFHNVCRHRGLLLVEPERGRSLELSCDYHGWIYEPSGALRLAPYMPPGFRRDCHGLAPVRLDVLHGFVFVCLDPEALPLAKALSGAPEWLTRPELEHLRLGRTLSQDVAANWKLLVENFQESHHFQRVHPALEQQTPSASATTWTGGGAWLGGLMELAPELRTVATPGSAERPFIVPEPARRRVADALALPALLTSLQPDYLLTYRMEPLAAARTRVTANIYFHAAAFAPELEAEDVFGFWDQVNAEDRQICERQQLGLCSRSFQRAAYSLLEEGTHAFDQWLARRYLETIR